jgi:hypothetical protein
MHFTLKILLVIMTGNTKQYMRLGDFGRKTEEERTPCTNESTNLANCCRGSVKLPSNSCWTRFTGQQTKTIARPYTFILACLPECIVQAVETNQVLRSSRKYRRRPKTVPYQQLTIIIVNSSSILRKHQYFE